MQQTSSDFKNMIGRLFFDRAKSVPESKQLSEDLVNSMYGTRFQEGSYRVVTLCAANLESPDLTILEGRMKTCARQLLERLTPECHEILYQFDHLRIRMLLNYRTDQDSHILFLLRSRAQAVPTMQNGSYPVVFCCSRPHDRIQNIGQMLEESSNIMWLRFSSKEAMLVYPQISPLCPESVQSIFITAEQQMKTACSILDPKAFANSLDWFFSLPDEIVGRFETRAMIRRVESYMFEVNRDLISSFTDVSKASRNMIQYLRTATSLSEYKHRYRNHLLSLMEQIIEHASAHLSRPIRIAQRYIQDHYAEPLHLETIAHHVGLTPVYLCSRFKQETGIGFSDYINRIRIDHAKQLLLDTQMPVIEIAQRCGYSGPRYFSRVFKEMEGLRPTQYRKAKQNG